MPKSFADCSDTFVAPIEPLVSGGPLRLTFSKNSTIIRIMTLFDDDRYDWRETYFVYFESSHRPKLPDVRRALKVYAPFFNILNSQADPDGHLAEMTVASYEDHAALEIVYREGNDILDEARYLVQSLKNEASEEERVQFQKIVHCKARFDVHHFEQTAGTSVFNITKLPVIKFSKQSTFPPDHSNVFSKALGTDAVKKGKFYFDPNSYGQCRNDHAGEELDTADPDVPDSGEFERIDPEMLVTVLEILCRISRGVALDPASGIVLD